MKKRVFIAILMLMPVVAAAQETMADRLRKAIVEEEANQNLDKAIQAYRAILAEYEDERKTAAAALLHLADCYRKKGDKDQAITAYRCILREFSDQPKLAAASSDYLTKVYVISPDQYPTLSSQQRPTEQQVAQARLRYRQILQQQIALVENQIREVERKVEIGIAQRNGPEMTGLRMELLDLHRTLAAFDAGALPIPGDKIK